MISIIGSHGFSAFDHFLVEILNKIIFYIYLNIKLNTE